MDLFMFNVFCPAVLLNCLGGCGSGCLNLGLQQLRPPKKPVCYAIPRSTNCMAGQQFEGDWKSVLVNKCINSVKSVF